MLGVYLENNGILLIITSCNVYKKYMLKRKQHIKQRIKMFKCTYFTVFKFTHISRLKLT